ncbi:unnamed protein product [Psylliodes chrysocephalus]|uniref:IRS-type PTB domain-containing protein n=1 Tax=Psylliodes chrysocephalus TaxID=3402493 RepID=A0A9P0CT19_9CUCU|nr:unnamed protein product [Psylliodes chrysocephala]
MGCIGSKTDINDRHPNIFQVTNVNDQGRRIKSGKLQVTDTDLVFYQRGKKPTKWPLRALRKYGFDMEIFSFECGRRCPTGHGIYAFKCKKAELLFNVVQQRISGNVTDEGNGEFTSNNGQILVSRRPNSNALFHAQTEGYLNPVSVPSASRSLIETKRPDSIGSSEPLSPVVSPPPVSDISNDPNRRASMAAEPTYTNSSAMEKALTLPPQYINLGGNEAVGDPLSASHVYMNVDMPKYSKQDMDDSHCYANIDSENLESLRSLEPLPCTPAISYGNFDQSTTVEEVNYAELDLNGSGVNNSEFQVDPTETNTKEKYVTIDFQKTTALSQSKNPSMVVEEGSRKTRHNSAINYNSSISD